MTIENSFSNEFWSTFVDGINQRPINGTLCINCLIMFADLVRHTHTRTHAHTDTHTLSLSLSLENEIHLRYVLKPGAEIEKNNTLYIKNNSADF